MYDAVDPKTKLDVWVAASHPEPDAPRPFLQSAFDEWQGNLVTRRPVDGIHVERVRDATRCTSRAFRMQARRGRSRRREGCIRAGVRIRQSCITSMATRSWLQFRFVPARRSNMVYRLPCSAPGSPGSLPCGRLMPSAGDGKRFLMVRLVNSSTPLTVVANWTSRLKP